MDDDFNTPKALAVLFELVTELNKARRDGAAEAGQFAAQLRRLGGSSVCCSRIPMVSCRVRTGPASFRPNRSKR
ncbi:DALR domain-containing protein [Marinobacterium aestuariivivens]|uniref:Cysteine--tRNA ligase n=1 Tax=Marinobacterium aestuariivivens TaxID=1698799 RepID=A0ABW2A7S4_9GAMM